MHIGIAEIPWNAFVFLAIYAAVYWCFIVARCIYWRINISRQIPGSKVRFYNFLGNINDLPLFGGSRNGHSILVYLQQLLGGYAKMFAREKLYCLLADISSSNSPSKSRSSRGNFWWI
ncbi:hypothetical protein CEXT_220481 [Caerostris extrusa]|uniref:Cytochrome P450 n=1 Tax=Caerostris extrusa TaxID=172846 RepID=A0AAV4RI85_CAEEX|nr:hypothetical protein CEXT_220481 [Caerostris extrusa]